jgi:hypothetical protein
LLLYLHQGKESKERICLIFLPYQLTDDRCTIDLMQKGGDPPAGGEQPDCRGGISIKSIIKNLILSPSAKNLFIDH